MKVQYHKFQKKEALAPALIRRLLLSWLTAAAGELLLLPAALRSMTDLKGTAQQTLPCPTSRHHIYI